jgi:AhpD family alkylhydroperoxidase
LTEKIDMDEKLKAMAAQLPDVMDAHSRFRSEVVKDGALSAKTKELMMVGIALALRCEYCLWKHVPEAIKLGATREEILESVSIAILMAGGPAIAYGSVVVLKILDEMGI